MAKTPPAPADAPVLDDTVELDADGAAPRAGWRARLPKIALKLPKLALKLPKIAVPKKLLIIGLGGLVAVGGAGAAAYAFWPQEPAWPRTPIVKKPKAKRAKPAASAAALAASAAASQAVASASAPEPVASGPENPIDHLQRRLAETLGTGGRLQADGPGELRLTARLPSEPAPARPARATPRAETPDAPPPSARRTAGPAVAPAWSYDGPGGPEQWGRLRPEYAKCATGARQSPIDLRGGIEVQLDPLQFDYRASRFGVVDTGRTVQVNVAPGNSIEVMGRRYALQQLQFHRPSEVRIDGRQFDMDVHLLHKDAAGRLAVVAIPLERGTAVQPVVQAVWNNLPLEKNEEQAAQATLELAQLLPAERGYYTYMGSLTAPPCSEGVLWMVMKTPLAVSDQQVAIFSRLYPMNSRPLQSAGGRMIKESAGH